MRSPFFDGEAVEFAFFQDAVLAVLGAGAAGRPGLRVDDRAGALDEQSHHRIVDQPLGEQSLHAGVAVS